MYHAGRGTNEPVVEGEFQMAVARTKRSSCGSCDSIGRSPSQLTSKSKALNVKVSFEEALKLKAAVDECVTRLNRKNRATKAGRSASLRLIVYLDKDRVQVVEG